MKLTRMLVFAGEVLFSVALVAEDGDLRRLL